MSDCFYYFETHHSCATLSIHGNASYHNCGKIEPFLHLLEVHKGKMDLAVDFKKCLGADSTVLGLIARTAIDFSRKKPAGRVILMNLQGRTLEVVQNLGLHQLLEVAETPFPLPMPEATAIGTESCDTPTILKAHQALIEANKANGVKFDDVISTLQSMTSPPFPVKSKQCQSVEGGTGS